MNRFRQIPFLRILIPFMAGLLFGLHMNTEWPWLIPFFFALFSLMFCLYFFFLKSGNKRVFLLAADAVLLLFGMVLVQQYTMKWNPDYYGHVIDVSKDIQALALVSDVPSVKTKTVKLQLELKEVKQNGEVFAVKGKLMAYVEKHASVSRLKAGQNILVNAHLVEVDSPRNPGEFDYKRYLYNRQIYHVAFIDSGGYAIISSANNKLAIELLPLTCKQWIVERLRTSSLSQEAFAICSALLTGFDEEIGQDIIKAFSHSGTLHVLSVSGLHTGLIFVFLSLIFDFFDRRRKYKVLKFSMLLLVLWAFALITGLAAPVFRSVVMLSLFAVGSVFFHNEPKNQLNLLFVSAFGLLCVNPYFITEVGFQLSFSAIFGLIVFEPFFSRLWEPQERVTRWLWKSTTASFAATLSTLPFTLFYFKQFPLWFFIANPVVVPLSFLLLALSVPALFQWNWVLFCIDWIAKKLLAFIALFDSAGLTYIDGIQFKLQDAFWLSLLITSFGFAFYNRSFKQLVLSVVLVLFWQGSALVEDFILNRERKITVYSVNKSYAYSVKEGHQLYHLVSDSALVERYLRPHALMLGNPNLQPLQFNVVEANAFQLVFLNRNTFLPDVNKQKPTYLVLSMDFPLKEEHVAHFKQIKGVVVDQSMRRKSLRQVEKLCRKFDLLYFNTQKQGAFILTRNEIENWR